MRSVVMGATAALVGQLALAGCSKPATTAPAQTSAATTATKTSLGPGAYEIPADCPTDVGKPQVTYITTIKDNFDIRKPVVDQKTEYPDGNPPPKRAEQAAPTTPEKKKTRMDTIVTLGDGQSGIVRIIIKAKDMRFRDDEAAVRGGDKYSGGMFCNVKKTDDKKQVEFLAYYKKGGPKTASYNLGIYVQDVQLPDAFELPIFLDPEVENNGVQ
jgi:hypothetical protein